MDEAIAALRAFNRFYTRFAGALDAHYMDSELSLTEARLLYEIANRRAPLAAELQAELGLDAGYVSRILRRFQAKGWIARGRGEDARRRPISLTAAGRAYFAALDARTRAEVGSAARAAERWRPRHAGRRARRGHRPAERSRARPGDSAPSAPAISARSPRASRSSTNPMAGSGRWRCCRARSPPPSSGTSSPAASNAGSPSAPG